MEYAVIISGGKQYKVSPSDIIEVESLNLKPKDTVSFKDVLLFVADGKIKVGNPTLSGVVVEGSVIEPIRGEKIRVSKFKQKVRYRRVTGHRQFLTKVKIEKITSKEK